MGTMSNTCTAPVGTKAGIGVSDVFATSCPNVTEVPDGIKDFQGPVQAMNFIVPVGADASIKSISAEAAYLTFGFLAGSLDSKTSLPYSNGTSWTEKDNIWVRDSTSGTQTMLGLAINVPASSWPATSYSDGASKPTGPRPVERQRDQRRGHLCGAGQHHRHPGDDRPRQSSRHAARLGLSGLRPNLRLLAQLDGGQQGQLNVRTGKYAVWGPIHMYAKVDSDGAAVDPDVADLLAAVQGTMDIEGVDVLALETKTNVIPQCAMQVQRNAELDAPMSVEPTCGCSYDAARGGDTTGCPTLTACTPGTCDTGEVCRLGFCEAE